MSEFIDSLKKEHKKLLSMLDGFKKGQGITGTEWKEKLFAAKMLFIGHLKKEDEKLYPVMLEASSHDEMLRKIAEKFSEEMKKVSEKTISFLDKYKAVSSGTEFMRDFAEVEIALKTRIEQEEESLYPAYEKMSEQ